MRNRLVVKLCEIIMLLLIFHDYVRSWRLFPLDYVKQFDDEKSSSSKLRVEMISDRWVAASMSRLLCLWRVSSGLEHFFLSTEHSTLVRLISEFYYFSLTGNNFMGHDVLAKSFWSRVNFFFSTWNNYRFIRTSDEWWWRRNCENLSFFLWLAVSDVDRPWTSWENREMFFGAHRESFH